MIRSVYILVVVAGLLESTLSTAQTYTEASCSIGQTSYSDSFLLPVGGEDDAFIGAKSRGLPSIIFVVDTSANMRKLPLDLTSDVVRAQGTGCINSMVDELVYRANPCVDGKGQPVSRTGCVGGMPPGFQLRYQRDATLNIVPTRYIPYDADMPALFDNTKYYVHDRGWGQRDRRTGSSKVDLAWVKNTPLEACAAAGITEASHLSEAHECAACLDAKGYYLPPSSLPSSTPPVLAGNWLNFFPPKYVIARKVLKDQFAALDEPSRSRQAMLTIVDGPDTCYSNNRGTQGFDTPGGGGSYGNKDGAKLIGEPTRFKPPCNQFPACVHNGSKGGGRAAFDNQVNGEYELFTSPTAHTGGASGGGGGGRAGLTAGGGPVSWVAGQQGCGHCNPGQVCVNGNCCSPGTCGSLGLNCGTASDGCGGTLSCGSCVSPQTCGGGGVANVCGCVGTTCAALGKNCGSVPNGCGGTLNCGSCASPQTCGGGGTANVCGCTPTSCAALGKNCGTVSNGCGGTLSCGSCSSPQTCGGGGVANVCGCSAGTCAALGKNCGTVSDGCGATLNCGSCSSPQTCGGGGTANVCGCAPTTCAALGKNCGSVSNGCGGTLNCGSCTSPQTCGGGGTSNVCGCTPTTCAALGKNCGSVSDGCGGTLNCGSCTSPQTCGGGGTANVCGCTPTSCVAQGKNCGNISNGCGGTLNCGSCTSPQTCGGAGTPNVCGCTPTTCAAQGANCGKISDGCGGVLNCGNCSSPQTCGGGGTANVCGCTPQSCAAQGKNCGTVSDGCGGSLNCGTCKKPSTCGGSGTANVCSCVPATCASLGKNCGDVSDGCGKTLFCGVCPANQECGGGGTANVCGCSLTTCAASGKNCGRITDGCGGSLNCGKCSAPETCGGGGTANVCGCKPLSCSDQGKNCGVISNGCGASIDCGTCPVGSTCGTRGADANVCSACIPTTCAAERKNCGPIPDGCGGTLDCGTCAAPDTCGGGGKANVCGSTGGICPDYSGLSMPGDAPTGTSRLVSVRQPDDVCKVYFADGTGSTVGADGKPYGEAVCAPYGEALLNAGQYLGSMNLYDTLFTSQPAGNWRKGDLDLADGVCPSSTCPCSRPVVILIAGGEPSFDDNLPCEITGKGCASVVPQATCGGSSGSDPKGNLAKVAAYLAATNLKFDDLGYSVPKVGLNTFVIGLGTSSRALVAAAEAGNGQFYRAEDATSLRSAINEALASITTAQLSFTNANISSVQTRTASSLLVPRFKPSAKGMWEGHLEHYQLVSEDACGCKETTAPEPFDPCDFNLDRRCGGAFFRDANEDFVASGSDGVFRIAKLNTTTHQFEPLPSSATCAAPKKADCSGTPLWDAAQRIPASSQRKIYTVVDSDQNGVFDYRDNVVSFERGNATQLLPYLNLGGGDFCRELAERIGTCLTPVQCAEKVIDFVRGVDIFDEDCDGDRTDDRPFKLGDIYHSAPILVDPPLSSTSALCRLGLHNQCLVSLFSTSTKMDSPGYDDYFKANQHRSKLVLVGANDGMLHAFQAGTWRNKDNPATANLNECPSTESCPGYYDSGTGDELWAFISPDLLPKLPRMTRGRHQYFVDATPMVRDVWADTDGNLKKSASEFHTVAVVGERRGGEHFFALDITRPEGPSAVPGAGFFRWVYPQPNTEEARRAGQTFAEFSPSPPPIGPVRVASLHRDALNYQGVDFEERWVALLNGGFDQSGTRGKSINMVDVWFGGAGRSGDFTVNARAPLWRFDAQTTGSFAAIPSMLAFGVNSVNANNDTNGYFFDTATVGDTSGVLWTLRFNSPDPTKWAGGRLLVAGAANSNSCGRQPFFHPTANVVERQGGVLHTMAGTGDRFNIADQNGGECSSTNLGACLRRGCRLKVITELGACGATAHFEREFTAANAATSCELTSSISTIPLGSGFNCCTQDTSGSASYELQCTNSDSTPVTVRWNPGVVCKPLQTTACGQTFSNVYTCQPLRDTPFDICGTFDRCKEPFPAASQPPRSGYYSVKTFDTSIKGRSIFDEPSGAADYDAMVRTTANLVRVNPYNAPDTIASQSSEGWYFLYDAPVERTLPISADTLNERTATTSTVIGGCAFWTSYLPGASAAGGCTSTLPGLNTQYHLNFLTGGACVGLDSELASTRYAQNTDTLPPANAQITVFVSPEGVITPTVTTVPRGQGNQALSTRVTSTDEILSEAYQLNVTRGLHACRHPAGATTEDQRDNAKQVCSP